MKINELRLMNETTIIYLKKLNKNTRRNEIIKEILKDEACFFKMKKEDALVVLEDVGVSKNKLEEIYSEVIATDNFYELYNNGKIRIDDKELVIKYKIYDLNIFKKGED